MKKLLIFICIMILYSFSVIGFTLNDNVRIIGEYRDAGILKNETAKLSIFLDSNTLIFNDTMTLYDTGRFEYFYNCTQIGEYRATVIFSNISDDLGMDSNTFTCGDINGINLGTCPSSDLGYISLWVFIIILLGLGIFGLALKYPILTGLAGGLLIAMYLYTAKCGDLLSYFCIIIGLLYCLLALNWK